MDYKPVPIKQGQLWRCGLNYVLCDDIANEARIKRLIDLHAPDPMLVYVDPPWRPQQQTAYLAQIDRVDPDPDMNRLHRLVLEASRYGLYVFIEMGRDVAPAFSRTIIEMGGSIVNQWNLTYRKNTQICILFQVTWHKVNATLEKSVQGMDHNQAPWAVMKQLCSPGDVVFDPCCGIGNTAIAAYKRRCVFLGVELVPERAYHTLRTLETMGAGKPERVEE